MASAVVSVYIAIAIQRRENDGKAMSDLFQCIFKEDIVDGSLKLVIRRKRKQLQEDVHVEVCRYSAIVLGEQAVEILEALPPSVLHFIEICVA